MYSYEERINAVKLLIQYDMPYTAAIQKLGILLSGELNGAPFVQQNARIRIPGIRYSTQMGRLCMSLRVQLVISPR